ncbi:MAG: MoaD/ThiS family protein [Pseudomonadota bacterium]
MKIRVDISMMPQVKAAVGKKTLEVDFEGRSISDLIGHIVERYGKKAAAAMFDEKGEVDPVIKVVLNGENFIVREQFAATTLKNGDEVKIMAFFAGG